VRLDKATEDIIKDIVRKQMRYMAKAFVEVRDDLS
jgi:hypothetical protein